MDERMSIPAYSLLKVAERIALQHNNRIIESQHILAALISKKAGDLTIKQFLQESGQDVERLLIRVEQNIVDGGRDNNTPPPIIPLPFSSEIEGIIDHAYAIACEDQKDKIQCSHLFLGILSDEKNKAAHILKKERITLELAKPAIVAALSA